MLYNDYIKFIDADMLHKCPNYILQTSVFCMKIVGNIIDQHKKYSYKCTYIDCVFYEETNSIWEQMSP